MDLREGYKITEIGVIPSEWDVCEVKDAYQICNNLRLPISENKRKNMQGKYPYYGPTKIQDYINEYRLDGEYVLIGEDGDHFLKWLTMPMTLLASGKFNVNNHAHVIKGIKNDGKWFYWYFNHKDITAYLTRQGASRYKLNKATLNTIKIPIPSVSEQKVISKYLFDVDNLINSLNRLLEKKLNIKQAVMQELLTGKKRIDKYKEEWKEEKLGQICMITTGKKDVNEGSVDGKYPFFTCSRNISNSDTFSFDTEAILIAGNGDVGNMHYYNGKFEAYQRTYVLYNFKVYLPYLFHYLNFNLLKKLNEDKVGSTIPYIVLSQLLDFPIRMPNDVDEQKIIAKILSDMDLEIEEIRKKLDKYKVIKRGMMQELLTGRIRLV